MELVNVIPQPDDDEAPSGKAGEDRPARGEGVGGWDGGLGGWGNQQSAIAAKSVLLLFNFSPQFITTKWAFIGTASLTACEGL